MKTIIERGASWTLEETKLLLSLWGQDLVQRKTTNLKRTKEVYEKISESFQQNGFERTAEQVRTRVFNMIAEYRRIRKSTDTERRKKCVFFEPLDKIYEAQHMDDVRSALDDYEPSEHPFSPSSHTISEDTRGDESISDGEATTDGGITTDAGGANNNNNNNTSSQAKSSSATAAAASKSSSNTNNNTSDNNNSSTADQNGDSNINNNINNADGGNSAQVNVAQSAKKIKLDPTLTPTKTTTHSTFTSNNNSAAAANNITDQPAATSTATSASTTPNSKQNKPTAPSTSGASSSAATLGPNATSTPNQQQQQQKHQSLLLPHATPSPPAGTSATHINKLITQAGSNNTPFSLNHLQSLGINANTKVPIIRTSFSSAQNGNEQLNSNGTTTAARLPQTAAITSHQLYQAPVNTFDVTSSALLIDRMFAHLSRESENMREWIGLEKERMAMERARRQQEAEREAKRDRVLTETLMKYQEQWLTFMSKIDPRFLQDVGEPPKLKINLDGSNNQPINTSNINTTSSATASAPSTTTNITNHMGEDASVSQASSATATATATATASAPIQAPATITNITNHTGEDASVSQASSGVGVV